MQLNALFDEFVDVKRPKMTSHTMNSKISIYYKHIAPTLGDRFVSSIIYKDLQTLLNDKLNEISTKSVHHLKDIITTVFAYAMRNVYIDKNPAEYLELPKLDNLHTLHLSYSQCQSFVLAVLNEPNIFWRAFFLFMLHGRRLNEVITLEWENVNLKNQTYVVQQKNSKDRKHHTYALTPQLVELLPFLPRKSDLVFPSPKTNTKLVHVGRSFGRILERADIDYMRIHDIRHLVATMSMEHGAHLDEVATALGHASTQTTKRYLTPSPQFSRKVSNLVLDLVKSPRI